MAVLGRADGCLASTESTAAIPIGYACALNDPDGNVVEFSFDERGVSAAVKEWFEERAAAADIGTSIGD